MATVRFSKELIDNIGKNARNKMAFIVTKAEETKPDNSWGQRIYDTMFLEDKPIISQVPAGWLKTVEYLKVEAVGGVPCDMRFKFATPIPWPVQSMDTALVKTNSWSDAVNLKDHLVWGEFHAEVVAFKQRVADAKKRQTEFVEMVYKVCNAYSTLAPALKAWPALWELVPEDVKDKHREIKEREKKEVVLDVDLSKLTAMSTAAKFGV